MDDYIIFKFRKIDKNFFQSLVNSELYFAHPDQLNDPFDCRVDFLAVLDNAIIRAPGKSNDRLKKIREIISEGVNINKIKILVENLGICSFSLEFENTLMWSHYADNHCGVCLSYGFPKAFFDETAKEIFGIVEVDYGHKPLSEWFLQAPDKYKTIDEFLRAMIKKAFTVKAEMWKYEREVRIVRKKSGAQSIDKHFLKQICFGLATSDNDIKLVKNIIGQCGYDISLCKMKRSASNDFGLECNKL